MPGEVKDMNLDTPMGDVVKAWREKRGWTVTQLAERVAECKGVPLSVAKAYLSKLEHNKICNSGPEYRKCLAKVLGVSDLDLVTRRMPGSVDQSPAADIAPLQ